MEAHASGVTTSFSQSFEKEAMPGSIRPDDKSPYHWSGILRDSAAIFLLNG